MTVAATFEAIIVGSGAGGSAAAYQLARAGIRVALIEKGEPLPQDGSTLDFNRVVDLGRFKSREIWYDGRGRELAPEEYFNLGGKTKWYGAALLRYGVREFAADPGHQCLGWPMTYEDLRSYYEQAERLLAVQVFPDEPDLRRIADRLERRSPSWRRESLPLGLSPAITSDLTEARHFDGFASVANLKSDAETAFLQPVHGQENLTILTGRAVTDLIGARNEATRIEGVRLGDGSELRADAVLLAAGALHSPRLLQRYIEAQGLAQRLPAAANVGRNLKLHLLTAVIALSSTNITDLLRKTLIFLNAELPHSSVQPLGFDGELMSTLIPRIVPRGIARWIGNHSYGFFLQTEDGAHRDNRVIAESAATAQRPVMDYDAARTPAAAAEHRALVRGFKGALARAGLLGMSQRIGIAGTAHVSGTLMTGLDPAQSVVDAVGRVHGMKSLYVVDGSVLPRSSRVNPSLTIYAWALRVADGILRQRQQFARALGLAILVLLAVPRAATADPAAPPVRAIESISLPVRDMDRSVAFYRGVLRFVQVADREMSGDGIEHLYGVFGARIRVVTLKLGEETLKLEQFIAPQGRPLPADSKSNDRWFQHVAIIVADMDRAYARLRAKHVEFASTGPQLLPQWNPNAGGISAFYFRDPDGHDLEVLHFPPDKGDPRWQTAGDRLFLGIDHTAIVVADTEASLAYYRDTLGLNVAGGSENYGIEQERLNNVFGARLRITALRAGHGPGVELLEYLAPRTGRPMPQDTQSNDLWSWHIDMAADVAAADGAIRAHRYGYVSPGPVTMETGNAQYSLLLRDPDGHATLLESQ
jgi:choline dehydrogenase-like flavoprotein/catechol 2,3-dioxygenase-like lactoylglutathione lyase family enzyme